MSNKCILCGNENVAKRMAGFVPFLVERMFDSQYIESSFVYCPDCDFYFSEYRPTPEQMAKLYANYRGEEYQKQRQKYEPYYTPEFNHAIGNLDEVIKLRKKHLTWTLDTFIDVSELKNVVDYGGDNGQFIPDCLENSNRYVYELSDVDTIPGVKKINSKEELIQHKWDFIMCCHVLEHVSYPMDIISEISSIMTKGSYLYVEVPLEIYVEKFNIGQPVPIHEHINFFRLKTMNQLFKTDEFLILTNKLFEQSSSFGSNKIISCLVQKIK